MSVKEETKQGRGQRGGHSWPWGAHILLSLTRGGRQVPPTSTTHQGSLELQEGAKHASCPPCTSVLVHSYSDLRSREAQRS